MQSLHLWITCAAICFTASIKAASEIKPVGILRSGGQTIALFDEFLSPPRRFHRTLQLVRGELGGSSSGNQTVSVTLIDPSSGLLQLERGGSNEVFQLKSSLPGDRSGILLQDASIDQMLAVYSKLAKTNILPHPELPENLFTLATEFADDSAGAEVISKTLLRADIVLIPFSQTFQIAIPKRAADQKFDRATFLKPKNRNALIEAGTLEVFGAPMIQLLDVCADLLVRHAKTRPVFGAANLRHELRLLTAATTEEVTDAFQLLFQWNGFRLIAEGDEVFALKPIR